MNSYRQSTGHASFLTERDRAAQLGDDPLLNNPLVDELRASEEDIPEEEKKYTDDELKKLTLNTTTVRSNGQLRESWLTTTQHHLNPNPFSNPDVSACYSEPRYLLTPAGLHLGSES